MENSGAKLYREHFAPLLNNVLNKMKDRLEGIIKHGFHSCGLYPFNINSIKFEKYFKNNTKYNSDTISYSSDKIKSFLNFFEK